MRVKTTEKGTHVIQIRDMRGREPSKSVTLAEPKMTVREIYDRLMRFLDAE